MLVKNHDVVRQKYLVSGIKIFVENQKYLSKMAKSKINKFSLKISLCMISLNSAQEKRIFYIFSDNFLPEKWV
jgi:hypothetical protein